jgi:hypothetical protein
MAISVAASTGVTQAAVMGSAVVLTQSADTQLAAGLSRLNAYAAAAQAALTQGDVATARAAYSQFDNGWFDIEDGVRARSRDAYRSIEDAMADVDRALRVSTVDTAQVIALLAELQVRVERFIATLPTS